MKKIEKIELYLMQKGLCFYCFKPINFIRGQGPINYTVDHFFPKINRNNLKNNAVLCHAGCNLNKGHRMPTKPEEIRKNELYRKIRNRRIWLKSFSKIL